MRKIRTAFAIITVIVCVLALLSACDTSENTGEGNGLPTGEGIEVCLWEGNSYFAQAEQLKVVYENMPQREGYAFGGWYFDNGVWEQPADYEDIINAESGTKIYAKWIDREDAVLVVFYDWSDAVILLRAYFTKGSDLSDIVTPSQKPSTEQYEYVFTGWDKALTSVTEDIEVRPLYQENVRSFQVSFVVDGVVIDTQSVKYGESAQSPSDEEIQDALPVVQGSVYKFAGWNKDFSQIKQDTVVTADITRELQTFTVTFNYGDGKSETQTVRYGEDAVVPTNENGQLDKAPVEGTEYLFVGWDNNAYHVTEDRVINAIYQNNKKYYTVDFYDGDILYCRRYVAYGEDAVLPEASPVKADDERNSYTFDHWEGNYTNITGNERVNAVYTAGERVFKVEFYADGKLIDTRMAYGYASSVEAPVYNPTSDEIYERKFSGWDKDLTCITSDTKVNAIIVQTKRQFKVTFNIGVENSFRQHIVSVGYGEGANAPEVDFSQYDDEQYHYAFAGWDNNFSCVTKDITVNSLWDKFVRTYEVRFVDEQGKDLVPVQFVRYGESAQEPSREVVTKQADAQYEYVFQGEWSTDDWKQVKGAVTAAAVFVPVLRNYTVSFTWLDSEKQWQTSSSVLAYGSEMPVYTSLSSYSDEKYDYTYTGWDCEVGQTVSGDLNATAVYDRQLRQFEVTFVYGDDKTSVQTVRYGEAATAPSAEEAGKPEDKYAKYVFQGWDRDYLNVTQDMTVNAVYMAIENYHKITFMSEDGKTLLSAPQYVRYEKDTAVQPDISTIVKASTAQYDFTFDGWFFKDEANPEGKVISAEQFEEMSALIEKDYEFYAHFNATVRKYDVHFVDDDGREILVVNAEYGTVIDTVKPENPEKAQTEQYIYTFDGWYLDGEKVDTASLTVTGELYLKAAYAKELRPYTVTFNFGDGLSDQQTVRYGEQAHPENYTAEQLAKTSTAKYDFAFNGWDRGTMTIYADTVINALYTMTVRMYTVTYYNMYSGLYEGENKLPYGSWIDRTMSQNGYVWDSWYTKSGNGYTALPLKEEVTETDEDGELIGHVQGDMTLYGNLVMEGFEFDSSNKIIGYTGTADFIFFPVYARRQKVNGIGSRIFIGREQKDISAVYIPDDLDISSYAFRSTEGFGNDLVIPETDVAKTLMVYFTCDKPTGGLNAATGRFSAVWSSGLSDKNVYWQVSSVTAIGDYEVIMYGGDKAILHKFLNASTRYVNMPMQITYKGEGDEEAKTYTVTDISQYCYADMTNIKTVFIPEQAQSVKFGKYMFSGVAANVYIAIERPKLGLIDVDYVVGKWNVWWNLDDGKVAGSNDDLILEWGCDGLATSGDVTYMLRSNGEAIAIEQNFTIAGDLTTLTIADTVEYEGKTYTVTELGSQLFKGEYLLTKVSIPGTIKKIGAEAFYGTNLKTLTLAEGLEEIGDFAFAMNQNLTYVYVPESCGTIGYFAFSGANNVELFMGKESAPTGSGLIGYKLGWNYTISLDGLNLGSLGLETIKQLISSGTQLPTYWGAVGKTAVEQVDIGRAIVYNVVVKKNGEAQIYSYSRKDIYLYSTNLKLPSSISYGDATYTVTSIRKGSFAGLEIESVFVPSTVTVIEEGAFDTAVKIKTDAAVKPEGWILPEGSTVETGASA